jgi:hypothetical protein
MALVDALVGIENGAARGVGVVRVGLCRGVGEVGRAECGEAQREEGLVGQEQLGGHLLAQPHVVLDQVEAGHQA